MLPRIGRGWGVEAGIRAEEADDASSLLSPFWHCFWVLPTDHFFWAGDLAPKIQVFSGTASKSRGEQHFWPKIHHWNFFVTMFKSTWCAGKSRKYSKLQLLLLTTQASEEENCSTKASRTETNKQHSLLLPPPDSESELKPKRGENFWFSSSSVGRRRRRLGHKNEGGKKERRERNRSLFSFPFGEKSALFRSELCTGGIGMERGEGNEGWRDACLEIEEGEGEKIGCQKWGWGWRRDIALQSCLLLYTVVSRVLAARGKMMTFFRAVGP